MHVKKSLVSRYLYESPYIKDFRQFKQDIVTKRVIPHQVEVQPGPSGKNICWLACPYCYGKSAINTNERLPFARYCEVLKDIIHGGCKKFIFAGWATDPLYYKHIDGLVQTVVVHNCIIGFNTRAIKITDRLIDLISTPSLAKDSYVSISVNAGSNTNYNLVNGVRSNSARLYDLVLENVKKIVTQRNRNKASLDISASYLINKYTRSREEIVKFITDFKSVGVDLIRFSCPQIPRGDLPGENAFIPSQNDYEVFINELAPVIESFSDEACAVIVVKGDNKFLQARTTPCFARFIYPTIGYDGWLYHCSQSSGTNFRTQALGNLAVNNFWDIFYDYDAENLEKYLSLCSKIMENNHCRCDRKEHTVNNMIKQNGFFDK